MNANKGRKQKRTANEPAVAKAMAGRLQIDADKSRFSYGSFAIFGLLTLDAVISLP